jgi:hypothetical protein
MKLSAAASISVARCPSPIACSGIAAANYSILGSANPADEHGLEDLVVIVYDERPDFVGTEDLFAACPISRD